MTNPLRDAAKELLQELDQFMKTIEVAGDGIPLQMAATKVERLLSLPNPPNGDEILAELVKAARSNCCECIECHAIATWMICDVGNFCDEHINHQDNDEYADEKEEWLPGRALTAAIEKAQAYLEGR